MKKKIFYRKEKKEKARGGGLEALLDSAERSRCTHTNSLSLTRARARAHTHTTYTRGGGWFCAGEMEGGSQGERGGGLRRWWVVGWMDLGWCGRV